MTAEQTAIRNYCHGCVNRSGRAVLGAEAAVDACSQVACSLHSVRPRFTGRVPADLSTVRDQADRQRLATMEAQRLGFASVAAGYLSPP